MCCVLVTLNVSTSLSSQVLEYSSTRVLKYNSNQTVVMATEQREDCDKVVCKESMVLYTSVWQPSIVRVQTKLLDLITHLLATSTKEDATA
jgi:predicted NAD/FAD-binding protein